MNITKLNYKQETMTSIQLSEMLGYEKKEINKKFETCFRIRFL